jgi:hypothetical protein
MAIATITFEDKVNDQGENSVEMSMNLGNLNLQDNNFDEEQLTEAHRAALFLVEQIADCSAETMKVKIAEAYRSKEKDDLFEDEVLEKPACNLDDHECESCQ